ncbi:pre-neck appendage protein [Bacillus phage poppyseed]|uniref:Tailspike n=2 Tax=Bacillus phage Page TaxID=1406786 RepID=U5PVB1_9CAUD|nr:tail spike protein [Bacillus phage Page]AGY47935.1 tailspike [Bacillus phage Page]AGY48030.1 pre-neck appendage protein [Bacillus phage poppyseed]
MPTIKAPDKFFGSNVVTEFIDSVGTSEITYTFTGEPREEIRLQNLSTATVILTVAGQEVTAEAFSSIKVSDLSVMDFKVKSLLGGASFRLTASYVTEDEEDEIKLEKEISNVRNKQNNKDVVVDYKVEKGVLKNAASLIQKAIDECTPVGLWVVIPKGDYYLEKSLIAKSGLKMIIHKDAKLLRYHNDCMVLNGVPGDMVGQSDIWIDGGQWDCRGHLIADDGSAFAMGYAKNITLRNLKIYNVNFSHGMEICAIDTADIEFCEGYGFIDTGGTRTTAEFIQIERGTPTGFPYFGPGDGTPCKNIYVKRAKIGPSANAPSFNVGVGSHDNIINTGAIGVHIIDCDFSLAVKTGMQLRGLRNTVVERVIAYGEKGVEIGHDNATETNVLIRDSDIKGTLTSGITLDGVTKLVIEHTKIDGYTNGIYGLRSKDIDIDKKCDISGQTSDAVAIITNSSNVSVARCIIRKAGRHAFNIYDNASHYRIKENTVIDVATNVFNLAGSNTKQMHIRENTVLDTTLTNIVNASAGVDKLFFKDNVYPASIATPIVSSATNSTVLAADNITF